MIEKAVLEEIKRRLPMTRLIELVGGATVSRNGAGFVGKHHKHESKSGTSFRVPASDDVYNCFNCGEGGDQIQYLGNERYPGTFNQSNGEMFHAIVTELASLAGVDLPNVDKKALAERHELENVFGMAADYYHSQLTDEWRAFLLDRYGLTKKTVDALRIGFAPINSALTAHLRATGVVDDDIVTTGLVQKSRNGKLRDLFQGRLVFPYHRGGKVVYFIARLTVQTPKWRDEETGEYTKEDPRKYVKQMVHSDNNPYVSTQVRNDYFYAEDAVKATDVVYVTEGVTDAIIANQYGIPTISPVTVRFRQADWPKLIQLTSRVRTVYIANDNEDSKAGDSGALATAEELWRHGKVARFVMLPRPDDVDKIDLNDFLRENDKDAFDALLPSAKTLLDLRVAEVADAATPEAKIEAMRLVFELLGHVKDVYMLTHHRNTVPGQLGISKGDYDSFLKVAAGDAQPESKPQQPELSLEEIERYMLAEGADDEGNAQCVLKLHPNEFIYCPAYGWMKNEGTHYSRDATAEAEVNRTITAVLKKRRVLAVKAEAEAIVNASKPSARHKTAAKDQVRDIVTVGVDNFDSDIYLLNCQNGVVDLRTKQIVINESGYFSYCINAAYDPDAKSEMWLKFLANSVKDYDKTGDWLQMAYGYSMSGDTREECLFYVFGPTRSGKGTFDSATRALLGKPLALGVNFSMFTARRDGDSQNFDLAPLKPCRFVSASESGKYSTLNEAVVKNITGNDPITAAFKHKDPFTFDPQFKIWLSSNHPVKGDVDDDAFWGRIRVVEFPNSRLGSEDKSLKRQMQSPDVLAGILTWGVDGACNWFKSEAGLVTPETINASTGDHREAGDSVGRWMDECTYVKDDAAHANRDLYASYSDWCDDNGEKPKGATTFGRALVSKGFERTSLKIGGTSKRGYKGLAILEG